jgi:uncharacterized protein YuzE
MRRTNVGFQARATRSQTADAVYVQLSAAEVAKTRSLDDMRMVDYAADGTPAGVEFLGVSGGVDLTGVPERQTVEHALRDLDLKIFA